MKHSQNWKSRDQAEILENYDEERDSESISNYKDHEAGRSNNGWEVDNADNESELGEDTFNNAYRAKMEELEHSLAGPAKKRKFDGQSWETEGKKSKWADLALINPPTVKELTRLRETEYLFHSNLFRLQVDEILKETKAKPSHETLLKKWIEDLKVLLLNTKPSKKFALNDTQWLAALGIELPIEKSTLVEGKCQVMKPTDVKVIGSYASGCHIGPNVKVDIAVEMPKESFVPKDENNHKYHTKRAIYLSYVTHLINTSTLAEDLNFVTKDSILNPILEVKPSGKLAKSVLVFIYVVPQSDSLEVFRLKPTANNIQRSWYFPGEPDDRKRSATPHYNASVVRDLTFAANEELRTNLISLNPTIRDGIILLKIWLRQRKLDEGHGCFSGFIMSMYVVYMLQARKLNNLMSSYQVARNVWNSIAQSDWCTEGITLCPTVTDVSVPVITYHTQYEVVFVDVTGTLNLCADVAAETFRRVRNECVLAMKMLNSAETNSFPVLFLTSKPLVMQSDHLLRMTEPTLTTLVKEYGSPAQQMNHSGQVNPIALPLVLNVLRRGLSQRTSHINVELPPCDRWPITAKRPSATKSLLLGLVLNPDHAFNVLEMGPEANLPAAAEFRAFWGALSQMRRFQDGSIVEVVVWAMPNAPINEKKLIPLKMVQHLLGTKFGVDRHDIIYLADQFELVLKRRQLRAQGFHYGTGENVARQAMASFDLLAKDIRMLSNIPLDIAAIAGSSPAMRYAEPFPPLATKHRGGMPKAGCSSMVFDSDEAAIPAFVAPIEGVIHLGDSSRWPDDLNAVRRIQAAFYSEIGGQLTKNQVAAQAFPGHLDVLKDGFVFRLRINSGKELALMKKVVTELGVTKYRDNPKSLVLEKMVGHLPRMTGALHGLYLQYSAFGPGCCLAKRWLRSHLLDETHFPDMCIELLVASLFLQPAPFEPTNQPQTAFFRFLRLLATTNWNSECFILDLNGTMTNDEIIAIESKFAKQRVSLPQLFIATSFDHTGSIWSRTAPTMQILVRVAYLAKAALEALDTTFFPATSSFVNVSPLFIPSTEDYDVVISLNPKMNPRSDERVPLSSLMPKRRTKVREYVQTKNEKVPIVGFNPVQCYLEELRENYGDFALFFHDPHGGLDIGVLWKPSVQGVTFFKVSEMNGRKLHNGMDLTLNYAAIIEDFYVIGEGIVENVVVKREHE